MLSKVWEAQTISEGVRARRRDDVTRQVLEIGRRHLTEYGAAALSLRAVTRDLGMVSSAVYRYVGSRDELLTLLVVDAYTELGDAVDARQADSPRRRSATSDEARRRRMDRELVRARPESHRSRRPSRTLRRFGPATP